MAGFLTQVFADADYTSKATDMKSVWGRVKMCGWGACVQWFSVRQKYVTISTAEAEYVAIAEIVKEVLFMQQVWRFMLPRAGTPCVSVFQNNEGAAQLAQNPATISDSKQIDVRHHFLRELAGCEGNDLQHARPVGMVT